MTFKELSYLYLERVFRLDYYDDVEWDSFKNAHKIVVGSPDVLYEAYIEQQLLSGIDFEELCKRDRAYYLSTLPYYVLKPPPIFV